LRSRKTAVVSGVEALIGSTGRVIDWAGESGRVRAQGEIWSARGAEGLAPGSTVRIAGINGLTLDVEPDTQTTTTGG